MATFSVSVSAFAAGASGTYITVAAIIGVAAKRARLKSVFVACDGETAHDEAMSVKLNKTNNAGHHIL